jgi:hypothetical protein
MFRALVAVALALLATSLSAEAQQLLYTGNSMGVGAGKCATYRMDLEVTVEGSAVKGHLKQQGRPERGFEATLGASGAMKAKAVVATASL